MGGFVVTAVLSFISGVFGTGLGGLLTVALPRPTKGVMSGLLAFAGGIMFSMVAFDLVPAAIEKGSILTVVLGLVPGMAMIQMADILAPVKDGRDSRKTNVEHYRRMGILIAIGISIHNFAEGLAIGSGYVVTKTLGLTVALIMAIHDIPEGIALAAPLRMGGVRAKKVLWISVLAGLPTAVGGFMGAMVGTLSNNSLSICLSIAAGAMLSIVADQLLPDAKIASTGYKSSIGFGAGIIVGMLLAVGI